MTATSTYWIDALVTDEVVDEIVCIGMLRTPQEACGFLTPNGRVIELPNRSPTPTEAFLILGEELREALENWAEKELPESVELFNVVIWHTHPSGHGEPSQEDLRRRGPGCKYLVVALPGGTAKRY